MRAAAIRPLAILLTLAVAALPTPVLASGFQLVEQNASGLGNAFAGQAAGVQDASAVFFNPAALTSLEGTQLVISVEPIGVGTDFTDQGSTRPSVPGLTFPVPLGGNGGDAGGWIPVPNAYLSLQVASQWWVGLGVNVPFGLETDWESDWVGRFHAVKSKVETLNINPTVAVKLSESFSLGAGVNYQRLKATLGQNVAYGGISVAGATAAAGPAAGAAILAQLGGPAGLAREGLAQIEGDTWSWGWNVGAHARLGEQGRLGVTYRSKIKHELEGDAVFNDAPSFATSGPVGPIGAVLNARFAAGPVTTTVELPETFSVAAAYLGDTVEVLADWTWTKWSRIQALDITRTDGTALSSVPLNFEDTWRIGGGVNFKLNEAWKLRLGTAFDKAPVVDAYRTPRLPDQDRTWLAGGLQWKLGEKAVVDLGYAHIFIKDATSELPNQETPTSTPVGALVGTYGAKVDILGVQLSLKF
jgi:long-chain fatty acid transport protein